MDFEQARLLSDHREGLDLYFDEAKRLAAELPEDAIFLDIGTRSGGSKFLQMLAIQASDKQNRWCWSIDPYGLKPYKDGNNILEMDYGEHHYREAQYHAAQFANTSALNTYHWRMTSLDYMSVIEKISFWSLGKEIKAPLYGLVFLDGDHDQDTVLAELEWFTPRTVEGGLLIVDDVDHMEGHDQKIQAFLNEGIIQHRRLWITKEQAEKVLSKLKKQKKQNEHSATV